MKCFLPIAILLAVSLASASAAAAAAAAIDGKSPKNEAAIDLKSGIRQDKSLKFQDQTYTVPQQIYQQQPQPYSYPAPSATYTDPNSNTMGFVYYYLPTVEKYYPKIKDFIPFMKKYDPYLQRAMPTIRRVAERTFDVGAALGTALLIPVLIVAAVAFLGIGLFSLVPVLAGKKRRAGRDVTEEFVPVEESRGLLDLVSRVDRALDSYVSTIRDDKCMEKFSCEAGQFSKRMAGGFVTNPIIKILEPFIPQYMLNKFEAFKFGARSGASCDGFVCKKNIFG